MAETITRGSFIADTLRGKIASQLRKGEEINLLYEIHSKGSADTKNFPHLDYPQLCGINGRLRKAGVRCQFVTQPKDKPWVERYIFLEVMKE